MDLFGASNSLRCQFLVLYDERMAVGMVVCDDVTGGPGSFKPPRNHLVFFAVQQGYRYHVPLVSAGRRFPDPIPKI